MSKLYTNNEDFGGSLYGEVANELRTSRKAVIATGYVSADIINAFAPNIKRLVRSGGKFDLIIGMAFFEGLTNRTYSCLLNLHNSIRSIENTAGGVRLVWSRKFHGKIYHFQTSNLDKIYLGSSNFSESGLRDNLESSVSLTDSSAINSVKSFLKWLNNDEQTVYIDKVADLNIIDSSKFKERIERAKLAANEAQRYQANTIDLSGLRYIDISLRRIDKQPKSNLNCYFGKGRWQRATGHVVPRNWFEVEIIVSQETTQNSTYPRGEFTVITDDGYTFECQTQSSSNNFKNFRSKSDLTVLGKWIKMKLQNAGALVPLTPVTSETLDRFGRNYLRLYKIADRKYFLEFKPS